MREFRRYENIDRASKEFVDPVILSQILLNQSIITANKKDRLINCLKNVKRKSIELLKNKNTVYIVIKADDGSWNLRGLVVGSTIVSLVFENVRENVELVGTLAYETIIKEVYSRDPVVKYSIGVLPLTQLPESIKQHVFKSMEEKPGKEPPYTWLNRYIYDIYIEKVVSDKGAYMHVLLGKDRFDKKYAVKIPREKTIDGKPLTVNTDPSTLVEVLKGVINSLEVSLVTRDGLKKGLLSLGYDEVYVDQLLYYRKYILRPKALIVSRNIYTREEYYEMPPVILEDYADLGDLDQRIRKKELNQREILFLGIRLSGALAIIHASHFIHMDIKPQNVLLVSDDEEPYGYSPLISDFVGSPHLFNTYIELKKSTPEYADPLSLVRGKANYSYDVYSLGATLFYSVMRYKLRGRVLVNLIALKNLYGVAVPLKTYLIENPDLTKYSKKVDMLYHGFKNRKIKIQDFIEELYSIIEEIDDESFKELNKKLPEPLATIIGKSLSLNETTRYRDSISLWIDFVNATKKLGYTNLIPTKTI